MIDKQYILSQLNNNDNSLAEQLFKLAYREKLNHIGSKVHLRGLIEISNICSKNCLYCGIRSDNKDIERYQIDNETVIEESKFAFESGYGSVVIQAGERKDTQFLNNITNLIKQIKSISDGRLGITLSLGEQSKSTYEDWYAAGAHRYLLRIEASNPDLYRKIHPNNSNHSYDNRLQSLLDIKSIGYQTGSGVMYNLPFQTMEDLADDLLFLKQIDIDMAGMGPYLPHRDTPLYLLKNKSMINDNEQLLQLSLKMIALLRLLTSDINIAATTALQVLHPQAREMAVLAGANIIMPNITSASVREQYQIYQNKPGINQDAELTKSMLVKNLSDYGIEIGWNHWGDSAHFRKDTTASEK